MQRMIVQPPCCSAPEAARPSSVPHHVSLQAQHSSRVALTSPAQRPEPCLHPTLLPARPCSRDGLDFTTWPLASMLGGVSDRYSARRLAPELDPAALLLEEPPIPKLSDRQTADVKRKLERDLNFGHAIRSLRDDIPMFFKIQRPQDLSIFTDDMVFIDNITPYLGLEALRSSTQGKTKYRRRLTALRTLVVCIFHVDAVRVHRFWQRTDGVLAVRWAIHGQPRLPAAQQTVLDGISEFRFNEEGYIYQHTVDLIDWEGLRPKQRQAVPVLPRSGSFN